MPNLTPTIHLAIAFDVNYLQHFYALFASVLENNKRNIIHVHAIITGVSREEQKRIERYATDKAAAISFYEIDEAFVKKFVLTNEWTSAVYYRLFFPLIVPPTIERLLYLDTDIIVINDLEALYAADLEHYPVGAVYDIWVKTAPQLGLAKEGEYFNSGMLLINVPAWREQRISEKAFDYLHRHPEHIKFVDQDALNAVLIHNWKKLDYRYNVLRSYIPAEMTRKERAAFLSDKVIIHYTLDRPWKMLCRNPFRNLYHRYLKKSPYPATKKYEDYSVSKLPELVKYRLIEIYFDLPLVQHVWRRLKI